MTLHPFPQLRRDHFLDLRGPWGFAYDDAGVGVDQGWAERQDVFDRTIEVPFPPESRASGIGDPGEHPIVWYRWSFDRADLPTRHDRGRVLLHFGAVDYLASVWVNGRFVGRHEGGHSSFTFEITQALTATGDQSIVIRAEDQPRSLTQPRGKQTWEEEPRRIWYHRTTGIWQPVWLESVASTYVSAVRWTPDTLGGRLGMTVHLDHEPDPGLRLRLRLTLGGSILADDSYSIGRQESRRDVGIEPAPTTTQRRNLLWSPAYPNLVDAELLLENAAGEVIDRVESYVGLRSVQASDGLFLLNGRPSYLRLVLSQGYWPESHLAAPSDDALRREVEAIKSLGFNGVRIHQKVEDPRFLYWCDRLGLFVWSEMANAYVFSNEAVTRFTREWTEVVDRDHSHPSIVTWVPFNESWGVPNLPGDAAQRDFVRAMYHLTKALDPTRPVIGNDGWEHFAGDIVGVHDYALEGTSIRERYASREATERTLAGRPQHHRAILGEEPLGDRPIVLSEFGGISFAPRSGSPWFGYGTVTDKASFLAKYEELMQSVLDSPTLAGFCYTQLTDTEQETNGLLNADRTPKLDISEVSEITRRPSKAIPGDVISAAQDAGIVTAYGESTT